MVSPPDPAWLKELDRLQRAADAVTKYSLRKGGRAEWRAQCSVASAAELLAELKLTRRKGQQPGSYFSQLSAVLYGDERADLHHYCETCMHNERKRAARLKD